MCGTMPPTSSPLLVLLALVDEAAGRAAAVVLAARSQGKVAVSSRWRARASGTRLVSMVIQRRPHCSAT